MAQSGLVRLTGDRTGAIASPPSWALGANGIVGGVASESPGWCGWGAQFTRDLTAGASAPWHLLAGPERPEGPAAGRAWPGRWRAGGPASSRRPHVNLRGPACDRLRGADACLRKPA